MSAGVAVAVHTPEALRRLGVLPVDGLPAGLRARVREFGDEVTGHTWHRVQVWPDGVDPDSRPMFGPGVVASVEWDGDSGGYLVYVSGQRSGSYVQACGLVRVFGAAEAVQHAGWEVVWEVRRQVRGW